jgi:DNA-binding response OmpR family regulator
MTANENQKKVLVVDDDRGLNHVLVELLRGAGFLAVGVTDGVAASKRLEREKFDAVLLDVGLPKMSGLDVLERIRAQGSQLKVLIMTADETPETVLRAVKEQAYQYVAKPVKPKLVLELVEEMLASEVEPARIEVISAKPDWVELLVPCRAEMADRLNSFLRQLNMNLPEEVQDSVATAFRELLMNAVEWGGRLDPARKVRIACIRAGRMLLYRIQDPGSGFRPEDLTHAAVSNIPDEPYGHILVREQRGLRPGGFGLLMTRAMVDELIYNEAHNEVVFVKYLT